jgi:hypothetical protein
MERQLSAMPGLASALLAASAFVLLVMVSLHLFLILRGSSFHPRDAVTRHTSMWKAWVGFNATATVSVRCCSGSFAATWL